MITESEKQRVSFLALTLTYKVTLLNNTDAAISLHIAHVTKYFLEVMAYFSKYGDRVYT